jgi:hypothetical protein
MFPATDRKCRSWSRFLTVGTHLSQPDRKRRNGTDMAMFVQRRTARRYQRVLGYAQHPGRLSLPSGSLTTIECWCNYYHIVSISTTLAPSVLSTGTLFEILSREPEERYSRQSSAPTRHTRYASGRGAPAFPTFRPESSFRSSLTSESSTRNSADAILNTHRIATASSTGT